MINGLAKSTKNAIGRILSKLTCCKKEPARKSGGHGDDPWGVSDFRNIPPAIMAIGQQAEIKKNLLADLSVLVL